MFSSNKKKHERKRYNLKVEKLPHFCLHGWVIFSAVVLWNVKMFYDFFFSAYICFSLSLMTLPVRDLSIHLKSLSFNVNLKYLEVDMTCCITKYTTHSTWAYKLSNWPLMGGTIKPGLQYEINLYYMGSLFFITVLKLLALEIPYSCTNIHIKC